MHKWRKYNGALIPMFPPHIQIDTNGLEDKIQEEGVYFARWTSNFDCVEKTKFWFVINDSAIRLEDYSSNTRSKIRRGLKNCDVKIVDKQTIINQGYEVYKQAFDRYKTYLKAKEYSEFCNDIISLSEKWQFWGVFFQEKLIAYSQNKIVDNYCDYSTIKFHPDYLSRYSSYALFYSMNQYYLNDNNFKYVNDGARSLSHETNIQEFLIQKFKFRKAYCIMHIMYNNKLSFIVNLFYPFRFIFSYFNFGFFRKLNVLLTHESIARSYED